MYDDDRIKIIKKRRMKWLRCLWSDGATWCCNGTHVKKEHKVNPELNVWKKESEPCRSHQMEKNIRYITLENDELGFVKKVNWERIHIVRKVLEGWKRCNFTNFVYLNKNYYKLLLFFTGVKQCNSFRVCEYCTARKAYTLIYFMLTWNASE